MTRLILCVSAFGLLGCPTEGVGDPCNPEQIPSDQNGTGFRESEVYLETSSVQCRTRVCMVHHLEGDPSESREDCLGRGASPSECASLPTARDIDQSVYCTCRCDAAGAKASTCECPDGYVCEPILDRGGAGLKGSYCVRASS